jgi:hypothetical protein
MQSIGRYCPSPSVFCRYATDPCVSDGDCKGDAGPFGLQCVPAVNHQGTMCQNVPPPPV